MSMAIACIQPIREASQTASQIRPHTSLQKEVAVLKKLGKHQGIQIFPNALT